MLDLGRLRVLREVEARGTVTAAAHALGYTPGAVSQQLAALQREAGVALLERSGRGVRLTEAGRVLTRHAAMLLAGVEAAEAELASLAGGAVQGTVRVAAFQSAALRIVGPALPALAAAHPDVRVEVLEAEVEAAVPSLRLGHLDVVVGDEYGGLPRPRHDDLAREPLLDEEILLVLPAAHPLARRRRVPLGALAGAPWSGTRPGTGHRQMQVQACRALGGFEPDIRHTSDDFLILLELVASAGACALLPELVHREAGREAAVRAIAEGRLAREIFLLTRRGRTPAVDAVAAALRVAAAHATGPRAVR
jgi:DNA-binding transcriptional LysR family regulator